MPKSRERLDEGDDSYDEGTHPESEQESSPPIAPRNSSGSQPPRGPPANKMANMSPKLRLEPIVLLPSPERKSKLTPRKRGERE